MEAFKLLTRSTKLKPIRFTGSEDKRPHVPSEGQAHILPVVMDETGTSSSEAMITGKKRKRGASQPVQVPAESLTPGKTDNANVAPERQGKVSKATTYEVSAQESSEPPQLGFQDHVSPEECRSIFKSHKVKMAVLTGDLDGAVSSITIGHQEASHKGENAGVQPLSRKRRKEASRLYPQPLKSFSLLNAFYKASRRLSNNIKDEGYSTPSSVQLATIPVLLDPAAAGLRLPPGCSKVNLLTIAPTGSGKTLAFLVPLISHLVDDHRRESAPHHLSRHLRAVIVAPTKELVGQIVNEGRKMCRNTGVSIAAMRKGMHIAQDAGSCPPNSGGEAIAPDPSCIVKVDILVTTPLLLANNIMDDKTTLSSVRHLVLDEADVLLDPLFRDQTLSLWDACTHPALRVSLWSATIGSNIEELVMRLISQRYARLGIESKYPLLRCIVGLKDSALPTICHKLIYTATEPGKLLGLRQLLHPSMTFDGKNVVPPLRPPFLVFTQTIERAVALHAELLYDIPIEAGGSSRLAVLHSDLSDLKRSEIMARFRKGQIWVLITTDLLSRGIDLLGVNGVVNYDIPTSSATYVHRVGRTGRAGRVGGMAVTFYTQDDIKYVKAIANAIAASEKAHGKQGGKDDGDGVQKWLLNALPDVSKKDRQELKKRGVSVRQKVQGGEDDKCAKAKRAARISTKSGYERRLENNRKGAIAGRQGMLETQSEDGDGDGDSNGNGDTWSGFDD